MPKRIRAEGIQARTRLEKRKREKKGEERIPYRLFPPWITFIIEGRLLTPTCPASRGSMKSSLSAIRGVGRE